MAAFATLPFEKTTGSSSTFVKVRGINVAAGSLLWCWTWQYNATNTCTGVADDINGAWVKAIGPQRSDASVQDAALYGWYKRNSVAGGSPTAGTVTATWSGSTNGGIIIGEITGLAGGGDLDQAVSAYIFGAQSAADIGVTAALAQAIEAAVQMIVTSVGPGTPKVGWTADVAPDSFNFEKTAQQITSATTALDCGWAGAGTYHAAGAAMTFKDFGSAPAASMPPRCAFPLAILQH